MAQRVATGSILVILGLVLIYFGGALMAVAGILCIGVALYEEYKALRSAGHQVTTWPTWTALAVSVPLALICGNKVVIPVLMAACVITVTCVIFRREPKLYDALVSVLPLFSVLLPGLCIIALSLVQPLSVQRTLLGLLLAVPILGDTLAFFVGSKVGGPKLCPPVSPNKTISGALASLVGSLLAAVIVRGIAGAICAPTTQPILPSWGVCVFLGVFGGAVSQVGDLFASLVKRHCGIKDYSNLFPGHGGMLDRLDSILFMSVVLYCATILF